MTDGAMPNDGAAKRRGERAGSTLTAAIVAAVAAIIVASAGGELTELGPWYQALIKPAWQPPDVVFPIAWTIIFALTAAAAVIGFRYTPKGRGRYVIAMFAVNGALNVLWSGLFFTLKRPDWAMIEVVFLWLAIVAPMAYLWRRAPTASLLLAPYLLWVTFAAALNWEIIRLNGPFG